jgi:hypothetical protein
VDPEGQVIVGPPAEGDDNEDETDNDDAEMDEEEKALRDGGSLIEIACMWFLLCHRPGVVATNPSHCLPQITRPLAREWLPPSASDRAPWRTAAAGRRTRGKAAGGAEWGQWLSVRRFKWRFGHCPRGFRSQICHEFAYLYVHLMI